MKCSQHKNNRGILQVVPIDLGHFISSCQYSDRYLEYKDAAKALMATWEKDKM